MGLKVSKAAYLGGFGGGEKERGKLCNSNINLKNERNNLWKK